MNSFNLIRIVAEMLCLLLALSVWRIDGDGSYWLF
jgi:hypothetical protein